MGLLDHARTWRFTLDARPEQCVDAFMASFRKGGLSALGKWEVQRTPGGAVATYAGRAGAFGVLTALSQRASAEEESARGSQVSFVTEFDGRTTVCEMWLSECATTWGLTSDARFMRPAMRAVADRLAELDAGLVVDKA